MRFILLGLALGVGAIHTVAAQRRPAPAERRWAVGLLLGTTSFSGATDATGPDGEKEYSCIIVEQESPGFTTRSIWRSAFVRSRRCWITWCAKTTSKDAS